MGLLDWALRAVDADYAASRGSGWLSDRGWDTIKVEEGKRVQIEQAREMRDIPGGPYKNVVERAAYAEWERGRDDRGGGGGWFW
jgi:hypothetical protein